MTTARPGTAPRPSGVLTSATRRAAAALGLSQRDLAAVLGVSEATISRFGRGKTIAPASKEGELAVLFLRLYRSLDTLVGGDDARASAWLHADNAHLGGPPAERIRTVTGLVDVVGYLDALRGKL